MKKIILALIILSLFALFSCKKAQEVDIDLTGDWTLIEQEDELVNKTMQTLFGSRITFSENQCILRPMDSLIEVPVPLIKEGGKYKFDLEGIKYGFKVIDKNKIQFNLLVAKGIYRRQ